MAFDLDAVLRQCLKFAGYGEEQRDLLTAHLVAGLKRVKETDARIVSMETSLADAHRKLDALAVALATPAGAK